jgi:hypothetical protein
VTTISTDETTAQRITRPGRAAGNPTRRRTHLVSASSGEHYSELSLE